MKQISLFFLSLGLLLQTPALANYLTIGESGEVIGEGQNRIGATPQFFTNEGGGMNIGAFMDMGWNEAMSSRFSLGLGKVDFNLGASLKYIPFPDVDQQPAIGIKTALFFARVASENITTLQLAPMVSRKVDSDIGLFVPYVAVALNLNSSSKNTTGTQFILGSELKHNEIQNFLFSAEVSFNLKDSYSSVAGFVSLPFDSSKGLKKR